ncbi:MAG: penicillin-binding protein 2 [Bacteroidota bacterium]
MNKFADRKYVIGLLIILSAVVFAGRLFQMQVIDQSYKLSAENNSRREVILYPARGLIYDRNGKLMVSNQAAYDIMVNPIQLDEFDTTDFCHILEISKEDLIARIEKAKDYNHYAPSVFMKLVPAEVSSVFQEKLFKFPGFFVQTRTLRRYSRPIAAHVLGYVGEVSKGTIEKDMYYKMGDYIGISGIEKTYEKILRGKKGKKNYMVDVHSRVTGEWESGRYDQASELGKDIVITIDSDLQEYGEKLMKGFSGSIVALEPSSGEILSMVSVPNYSPGLLVGRGLRRNFRMLSADTLNPIFNRAVAASYPPGSTFKIINGLIALQEDVLHPSHEFYCDFGYYYRGIFVGCHDHLSPLDLEGSIQNSCNAYFCNVFRRIMEDPEFGRTDSAFNNWRRHVASFGFGNRLNSDIPGDLKGFVPDPSYYNLYYGAGRWNFLTVISLSIGQGELGITPLQMANMTAAIANRGSYYTPHILKEIRSGEQIDPRLREEHKTTIDSAYFETVIDGMDLVVNGGEGSTARIAKMQDVTICGKTGTAENPFGEDHSIFVAFAPKEDPQIAIAVYVENVGFGSTFAAPIASLMIEKYLTGKVERKWIENYVLVDARKRLEEKLKKEAEE